MSFSGTSIVITRKNEEKCIKDVLPGDVLKCASGYAKVKYVAEVNIETKIHHLTNTTRIVPNCLVRVGGSWIKASELPCIGYLFVDKVYNFVLSKDYILLVDGFECLTWGSDFIDSAYDPFFGSSEKIEKELSKLSRFGVCKITQVIKDDGGIRFE